MGAPPVSIPFGCWTVSSPVLLSGFYPEKIKPTTGGALPKQFIVLLRTCLAKRPPEQTGAFPLPNVPGSLTTFRSRWVVQPPIQKASSCSKGKNTFRRSECVFFPKLRPFYRSSIGIHGRHQQSCGDHGPQWHLLPQRMGDSHAKHDHPKPLECH